VCAQSKSTGCGSQTDDNCGTGKLPVPPCIDVQS